MSKLQLVKSTFRSPWTIFSRGQNSFMPKAQHSGSGLSTKTTVTTQHQKSICTLPETGRFRSQFSLINVYGTNLMRQNVMRRFSQVADQGNATHKPTPFQQRVLVLSKTYPSIDKIPERVTRQQMRTAMDKFRVRVSIIMAASTFIFAAIMALIGRRERMQGHSLTSQALARKQASKDSEQ